MPRKPIGWGAPPLAAGLGRAGFRSRSLQVQRQQPREDFIIAQVDRPAVGGEHGLVQFAMRVVQPRGPLVVEVGQGAVMRLIVE